MVKNEQDRSSDVTTPILGHRADEDIDTLRQWAGERITPSLACLPRRSLEVTTVPECGVHWDRPGPALAWTDNLGPGMKRKDPGRSRNEPSRRGASWIEFYDEILEWNLHVREWRPTGKINGSDSFVGPQQRGGLAVTPPCSSIRESPRLL